MALDRPTDLIATTIGLDRIDLSWRNRDRYQAVQVWRQREAEGWIKIEGDLSGSDEYYQSEGLDSDTLYTYYVVGETIEPPETSPDSDEANDTTFIELQAPSDCVVTAFADFIEITWKDNSSGEDDFCIYRQVNGGGYPAEDAPTYVVAANVDYYRDEIGINPGSTYEYKIKARAGGPSYSGYSNADSAVALSAPPAPTLAAILAADTKDKSMRIRWTDVANETGYRIEMSKTGDLPFGANEADLIAVVGAGVTDFLATGLDVGTAYSFRVRAYNGVGNSAFSATRAATTDAAYVPTEFEEWIRDPNIEPVYLAEIYTKMDLTDFVIHGAGPAWKKTIDASDRGIDILEVFEDGTAYTEVANVAAVEALASSFWFDYDNRILYVRSSAGDGDPVAFLIEGAFWLYFSTHKDKEFTVNGRLNHFPNYLSRKDIPDITQEIKPYFEGNFGISSGSIAFANAEIGGEHFFDKKYVNYTWENSKVILKAGKDGFNYEDFKTILTSLVDQKSCNDSKITFTLRDIRQEMERNLILAKFTVEDYPDIEEDFIGEPIPIGFGTKYNVVAIPIDVVRRKYKFHDGRSKNVLAVYKNWVAGDTPLVEDADYFVDLQRSVITFERDTFELGPEDIIDVSFIGTVNSADEPIANGAEVFKYLMNQHYGLLNSDLNLDSIYATKYAKTNPLAIFLYKDIPYREIVRTIEHSTEAFTFQDSEGRLGLKTQLIAAESNATYIRNYNIFNHRQSKTRKLLFWKVNIFWNENPQLQEWEVKSAQDDDIWYRYKNRNELNIYSYFSAPSAAQDLADAILGLLNKETIENTASMLLFNVMAGDIIKFSRDRFYSTTGSASEIDLRIIRISKSPASGQTTITAEIA